MKHTPTPWVFKNTYKSPDDERIFVQALITEQDKNDQFYNGGGAIMLHQAYWEIKKQDCKFIVRACNSHDALVEALLVALEFVEHGNDTDANIYILRQGRKALALAGVK